ncbi:hypothetical protein CEXT_815061 [Caerostris extrusa]|uniref:Uncharacterized protein n=1 Tax=Caerostris extrusa TaxID=172846 RepID=A0AAV4R464_CAEEX|nr:hypothetical protein CEXT_815061 [Caerostris extrusa]
MQIYCFIAQVMHQTSNPCNPQNLGFIAIDCRIGCSRRRGSGQGPPLKTSVRSITVEGVTALKCSHHNKEQGCCSLLSESLPSKK